MLTSQFVFIALHLAWDVLWFYSVPPDDCRDGTLKWPRPLPFTSFPICYWLIVLSFDSSLNTPQTWAVKTDGLCSSSYSNREVRQAACALVRCLGSCSEPLLTDPLRLSAGKVETLCSGPWFTYRIIYTVTKSEDGDFCNIDLPASCYFDPHTLISATQY
jgi:hypothetical protein